MLYLLQNQLHNNIFQPERKNIEYFQVNMHHIQKIDEAILKFVLQLGLFLDAMLIIERMKAELFSWQLFWFL